MITIYKKLFLYLAPLAGRFCSFFSFVIDIQPFNISHDKYILIKRNRTIMTGQQGYIKSNASPQLREGKNLLFVPAALQRLKDLYLLHPPLAKGKLDPDRGFSIRSRRRAVASQGGSQLGRSGHLYYPYLYLYYVAPWHNK